MKFVTCFIVFVCIGATVYGQEQVPPQPPGTNTSTTTHPPKTSTASTKKPTITTVTPKPSPTNATTTSTTQAPTTPTTKSTTVAPNTTTPSPTPPKPPACIDPTQGKWSVNIAGTNKTCLLLQAAVQIEVPYVATNNETFKACVNVPQNATATGVCNENNQITISWNGTNELSFSFAKNASKYSLADISVKLTPNPIDFPFANGSLKEIQLHHTAKEYETSISKSYKCVKEQKLNLTDTSLKNAAVFDVREFQFEAFHNSTNTEFSSAEDCSPFDTPDVVPIVVGCILAALVAIVFIAYLIGRRRRQARGYLSM